MASGAGGKPAMAQVLAGYVKSLKSTARMSGVDPLAAGRGVVGPGDTDGDGTGALPGVAAGHALLGARPTGRWADPGAQDRTHPAHRHSKDANSGVGITCQVTNAPGRGGAQRPRAFALQA